MRKQAMSPAERKRRQRARERNLGMKVMHLNLAESERDLVAEMAASRGFVDQTEYLVSLVRKDWQMLKRDISQKREF